MPALKESALGKFKGDLFLREVGGSTWTDYGAVRGLVANLDGTEITEINSDNRGTLIKFTNLLATVNLTLLETQDRDKIDFLFNTTSTDVAGTPVAITNEAMGSNLAKGTIYTFANKNGANTQVASISLADTGGALVLNTDYALGVDENGFTYAVILVATTGATTVNYTYTPNESEQSVVTLGTNELKNFEIQIKAVEDTKIRTITLSSATLNTSYAFGFTDIVEAADIV
jgi:hypothetical protein